MVWTRVGYPSLPAGSRDRMGILSLNNVRSSDAGRYECVGSTPTQSGSDYAELVVVPSKKLSLSVTSFPSTTQMIFPQQSDDSIFLNLMRLLVVGKDAFADAFICQLPSEGLF